MATLIIVSFFIVALASLEPVNKNSLYSVLYTKYLPTDRVILAILLSFKLALFLLLLTLVFLPVFEHLTIHSSFLYLLNGILLSFYSIRLIMFQYKDTSVDKRENASSFLKEAWGLRLFSSKISVIVLFIYMITLQQTYQFSLFNFGILDLIVAILLGILFLCSDILFKLLANRRAIIFNRILGSLLILIGANFFIKGIVLF